MKKYYDQKRGKTPQYALGREGVARCFEYPNRKARKKLDHKRLGPFPVSKGLANNTYELKLPKTMKFIQSFLWLSLFHITSITFLNESSKATTSRSKGRSGRI